jgi:hypothetical protein
LRRCFPDTQLDVLPEGNGGAYVFVSPVDLGEKFEPRTTWMGAHLTPQLPYSDVYPLFIGADVKRRDGQAFVGGRRLKAATPRPQERKADPTVSLR